ncbi:MAG: kelch motif-containing protein, partial [Candidatus Azobacteroides sp.]|nr:kelch motif-containing protein [Candidatus Azobacteroides sp.]
VPYEYPVKNIFGTVDKINVLALAVEKDGLIVSATFDGTNWQYGNELPSLFPTEDFSSISYTNTSINVGHLSIAGGTSQTAWGTIDGLYWAKMGSTLPPNVQGANIFLYDNKFYLLNGSNTGESSYNKSIYTSSDGAITWQLSPSQAYLPPDDYKFRTGASVVVSKDNTIYIIGGQYSGNPVTDIWKGRLNKLNQL